MLNIKADLVLNGKNGERTLSFCLSLLNFRFKSLNWAKFVFLLSPVL